MTKHQIQNPYTAAKPTEEDSELASAQTIQRAARTGMIITFALIQGMVMIAALLYFVVGVGDAFDQGGNELVLPGIGAIVFGACCLGSVIVPGLILRGAEQAYRQRGQSADKEKLVGSFMSATLVSQAMLEGAGTLNAVLMVVQPLLILQLGIVVCCAVGIAARTPTEVRIRQWIERVTAEQM